MGRRLSCRKTLYYIRAIIHIFIFCFLFFIPFNLMILIFIYGALVSGLSLIIIFVRFVMGLNFKVNDIGPYECGFTSYITARRPFSLRFYLLAVLFLIFDIELVVVYPLVFWWTRFCLLRSVLFIVIVLLGLFHESREGCLEWKS